MLEPEIWTGGGADPEQPFSYSSHLHVWFQSLELGKTTLQILPSIGAHISGGRLLGQDFSRLSTDIPES